MVNKDDDNYCNTIIMEACNQTSNALMHEEIASAAYNLWEQAGHPLEQDMDFWLQAERLLYKPSGGLKTGNSTVAEKQPAAPVAAKALSASRAKLF